MLISKFNKLIRNKFVWAIFAILVSLSMVGLFAPQPQNDGERGRSGLGTLFGEDVSREDFVRARLFSQGFQPMRGGEDVQRMIDDEAWRRLAILGYAEDLGLQVSRDELVRTIQSDPSFAENGQFNLSRYQFLIEQQLGVPVAWFEEYIRQEILIGRVRDLLEGSLWIPASELEENASRFTDTYTVSYTLVQPDESLAFDEADEAAALGVYTNSPDLFLVPEQRRVVYAKFPHGDYLDVEQITDRLVEMRYEADPERFAYTDPETAVESIRPLEEVSDEIRLELAQQEAAALATDRSMELVDKLSIAEDDAISLDRIATGMGLAIATSVWFQASGVEPEEVSAGGAFVQAAFRLSAVDPSQSFSFSVAGTNAVYVMQLHEVAEEHLPPFEDVREAAFAIANERARDAAFAAHVSALHERIAAGLADGGSFSNVVSDVGLRAADITPFTLMDADPGVIPYFGDLAPDLLPLQAGEITQPIATTDGSLIGYLAARESGALEDRLAIKPDLVQMMSSGLENVHFMHWADSILAQARQE